LATAPHAPVHVGAAVGGVDHDLRGVVVGAQRRAQREPVLVAEAAVEHDHVGGGAVQHALHLGAVGGDADAHEAGLGAQHRLEPRPEDRVVVDDEDANHRGVILPSIGWRVRTGSPRTLPVRTGSPRTLPAPGAALSTTRRRGVGRRAATPEA
jgi:hypothetical protein